MANYRYLKVDAPPWPADLRETGVVLSLHLCAEPSYGFAIKPTNLEHWKFPNGPVELEPGVRLKEYRFGPPDFEVLFPENRGLTSN